MDDWFLDQEAGRYWLKECIGHGGSGSVFRGYEILQKRPFRAPSVGPEMAVKIVQPNPANPDLFRTLELAASLKHDHILRCETPGEAILHSCSFYYLPMEMAGESLHAVLQRGPLTVEQTPELAGSLASALDYTHTLPERVVHCDLKPGNILRVGNVWKLCDFGIARVLHGTGGHLTETTSGTEGYMPPERLLARKDTRVDTPYDIWPLGIILLEALGRLEPGQGKAMTMTAAVLKTDPELPADLPAPLGEIVRGCLLYDSAPRLTAREIAAHCGLTLPPPQPRVQLASPLSSLTLPIVTAPARLSRVVSSPRPPSRPPQPSGNAMMLDPGSGITMQLSPIPAGDFLMGDKDRSDYARRKVFLDEFTMQTTPVTVAQYRAFCVAKRRGKMPSEPKWGWQEDHPILNVTFEDAQKFCAWVAEKTRRRVRLPKEEEWEKAARGADGKKYPWGNEDPTEANAGRLLWSSIDSKKSRTNAVGRFPANEFGLFDMAGNVWEWCDSLYDGEHDWRVVRGGSWGDGIPVTFRAASRSGITRRLGSSTSGSVAPQDRSGIPLHTCSFSLLAFQVTAD